MYKHTSVGARVIVHDDTRLLLYYKSICYNNSVRYLPSNIIIIISLCATTPNKVQQFILQYNQHA